MSLFVYQSTVSVHTLERSAKITMNTTFKTIWLRTKSYYTIASELSNTTRGKKKILVAAVLTALAMTGPLEAGAATINPNIANLDAAEFGLVTDHKHSIINKDKAQFFDGDINTAITANGTKLENTNNLDTAQYTMDGMQADSNGKFVRFSTDGIKAGNQVIEGVQAGVADTDVVNVKQLKDSISNIGKVKTSTLTVDANGKVTGKSGVATSDNVATVINRVVEQNTSDTKELKQAISSVSSETQRVGAHAAAMAALKPIQYDPMEPTQVMAGVGNYRGETAAALGLAHYTNENTMLNVGVSFGSHNMVNAGVTHKFGYSPEKKNIPDRYKGGPISSIYVMQDEMTRMQAKNDAQQVEIEQQRAENEELQDRVAKLEALVQKLVETKA